MDSQKKTAIVLSSKQRDGLLLSLTYLYEAVFAVFLEINLTSIVSKVTKEDLNDNVISCCQD